MKIKCLHAAILALSLPITAYSMGMGEMKVSSFLGDPFSAEIRLLDVDGIPLSGIKANVASIEDFERIGMVRDETLDTLIFTIKKNEKGQNVISIKSDERISDPYLEIVVDLTWANGQLYRAYTVLLDPPGYKLVSENRINQIRIHNRPANQAGVINKPIYSHIVKQGKLEQSTRRESTYGPTLDNETIWQIAQRYTTPDTNLQQVVLAIVGTNPDAFTQGNLNGLKTGQKLKIPASDLMLKIPPILAKKEVDAHDLAWQSRNEIKHVLLPPYTSGIAVTSVNKPETQLPVKAEEPTTITEAPRFDQASSHQAVQPEQTQSLPSNMNQPANQQSNQGQTTSQSQKTLENPAQKTPANVTTSQVQKPEDSIFAPFLPTPQTLIAAAEDTKNPPKNGQASSKETKPDEKIKAEIDITTAAINSVRDANSILKDQLTSLQKDNQRLQQQMQQRDEDIKLLRQQISQIVKERQGLAQQKSKSDTDDSSNLWLYLLLLVGVGIAGGAAYWWFLYRRDQEEMDRPVQPDVFDDDNPNLPATPPIMPLITGEKPVQPPASTTTNTTVSNEETSSSKIETDLAETEPPENIVNTRSEAINDDLADEKKSFKDLSPMPDKEPEASEEIEPDELSLLVNERNSEDQARVLEQPYREENNQEAEPIEEDEAEHMLDFEPGLHKMIEQFKQPEQEVVQTHDPADAIEFTSTSIADTQKADHNVSPADTRMVYEHSPDEPPLEFEQPLKPATGFEIEPEIEPEIEIDSEIENEFSLEDEFASDMDEPVFNIESELDNYTEEQQPELVKSNTALDTLLALAKTYISMDDIEAARQSLNEIIEHGDGNQKAAAQKLLDELKDK